MQITFAGVVKAEVRNIYVNGERVSSSYFTARTKTIFRSASAKYFVFVQVCRETYEFDEDGERYYEKALVRPSLAFSLSAREGLTLGALPARAGRLPARAVPALARAQGQPRRHDRPFLARVVRPVRD